MNFKWKEDMERYANEIGKMRETLKMDSTNPEIPRMLAIARTNLETAELYTRKVASLMS